MVSVKFDSTLLLELVNNAELSFLHVMPSFSLGCGKRLVTISLVWYLLAKDGNVMIQDVNPVLAVKISFHLNCQKQVMLLRFGRTTRT